MFLPSLVESCDNAVLMSVLMFWLVLATKNTWLGKEQVLAQNTGHDSCPNSPSQIYVFLLP